MLSRLVALTAAVIAAAALVLSAAGRVSTPGHSPPPEPKVTLAVVGDVLLARGVGRQIALHGLNYLCGPTADTLKNADIAFFNLECPLSRRGVPCRTKYLFRADPTMVKRLAAASGLDVACLANNHSLDYGRVALLDTIRAVEDAGMTPVGAGIGREDALRVRVVARKGLHVGFIGYTDFATSGVVRLDDKPTVAGVNETELSAQVAAAKRSCDVLVVSMHWGVEYMKRPIERQQRLARLCIDSGADAVIGHHPHVLQTVETYSGKPIIYSAGGYLWDYEGQGADISAIYLLELSRPVTRLVETIPLRVHRSRPLPHPAEKAAS